MTILDSKTLDELARKVQQALPPGVETVQADLRKNIRAVLSAGLARMELVTREEFDVQSAVLARSREKISVLEERVATLEQATRKL